MKKLYPEYIKILNKKRNSSITNMQINGQKIWTLHQRRCINGK